MPAITAINWLWGRRLVMYNISHKICTLVSLYFVLVSLSSIVASGYLFSHIRHDYFTGTGAIVWLPQCQWSNPEGYGLNRPVPSPNKAQRSASRVDISWDVLQVRVTMRHARIMDENWHFNSSPPGQTGILADDSLKCILLNENHSISRVTSLAPGQSYDCPSTSEITLKDMG